MYQEPLLEKPKSKLSKSSKNLLPKGVSTNEFEIINKIENSQNMTIIAFINPSAGGGQGVKVLHDLSVILGPEHCYDLKADHGPAKGLNEWKNKTSLKDNLVVIAGGGDGTVGWVLTVIDTIDFEIKPSVVPLALGTANDMSRILRWGKGYTGENLYDFVNKILNNSYPLPLDRWMVSIKTLSELEIAEYKDKKPSTDGDSDDEDKGEETFEDEMVPTKKNSNSILGVSAPPMRPKQAPPLDKGLGLSGDHIPGTPPTRPKHAAPMEKPIPIRTEHPEIEHSVIIETDVQKTYIANNYFSIGIDSKMLLEFDQLRKSHPELFPHRMINFGWYGLIGLKSMTERIQSLRHFSTLIVDNKEYPIPKGAKALIFMNVPSYSGGTNPWRVSRNSEVVPEKVPQSICDGILEIFAMEGAAHIGRNFAQVSRGGIRICQGRTVTLITTELVAGQVDGEPYWFAPSKVDIKCQGQGNLLYCTVGDQTEKKRNRLIGKPSL